MWIKVGDKLYNVDDFRLIEQLSYGTVAICRDGRRITLSSKPILQKFIALLNPKEVD